MGLYSNELIKCKNGYVLRNYKMPLLVFFYFLLLILNFWLFICIWQLILEIKNNRIETNSIVLVVVILLYYTVFYFGLYGIKNILIDLTDNKVIFRYGLFPFFKIKILKINNIKQILISHTVFYYGLTNFNYRSKEKEFHIDILDKEENAYRIYQSEVYNNELIDFSKKISEILNVNINNQNNIEGNKNIYKKLII